MNFVAALLAILACAFPLIAGHSLAGASERLSALNEVACRQNSGDATSYSHLVKLFSHVPKCISNITADDDDGCPVEQSMLCYEEIVKVAASCLPGNLKSNELVSRNVLRQIILARCNADEESTNSACDGSRIRQAAMQCSVPIWRMDYAITKLSASECRTLMDNKQCMSMFLKSCPHFAHLGAIVYDVVYAENECEKYAEEGNAENEI